MELQLKQQKLLDAKSNNDGSKSPLLGRSPPRSPRRNPSPGGSKVFSNILFAGIDDS